MATGKVKWFNNAKGYGFILPDNGDDDLFVHYSSITMDGYKTLKAGQEVSFDVLEGPKGLHATNINYAELEGVELSDVESDQHNGAPPDLDGDPVAGRSEEPAERKTSQVLSVTVEDDSHAATGNLPPSQASHSS